MKKITCIQQYVIDKLIDNAKLSIGSLIDAMSKVCSKEQFDNILSILIETPIPCTNMPEIESKISLVRMSMFVPKEVSGSTKMEIIKILKTNLVLVLDKLKNMQIVVQENTTYLLSLLHKKKQILLPKN